MMIAIAADIVRVDDTDRALDLPVVTTAAMTATGKVALVVAVGTLVAASTAAEVAAGTREAPALLTTVKTVTAGQSLCNRFPLV